MNCSRAFVAAGALLACAQAQAALGELAQELAAEAIRAGAAHRMAAGAPVHVMQWSDGSQVRQYVGGDGRVFAVTWTVRGKPPLATLLGRHYERFAASARRSQGERPGVRHGGVWRDGDLVVEQFANADAFVGRAYLSSLLPAGRRPDAIR
jgi:hypothetical protein